MVSTGVRKIRRFVVQPQSIESGISAPNFEDFCIGRSMSSSDSHSIVDLTIEAGYDPTQTTALFKQYITEAVNGDKALLDQDLQLHTNAFLDYLDQNVKEDSSIKENIDPTVVVVEDPVPEALPSEELTPFGKVNWTTI